MCCVSSFAQHKHQHTYINKTNQTTPYSKKTRVQCELKPPLRYVRQAHLRRLQALSKMQHLPLRVLRIRVTEPFKRVPSEVPHVRRRIQIDRSFKGNLVQIMKLDWDLLSDRDFESLCYDILERNGFQKIEWFGRYGSDRQRDIKCTKPTIILGITIEDSYIVQCKKWVKRPPSISELNRTLAWADAHKPDVLLFMISNTLTSNTRDWVTKVNYSPLTGRASQIKSG